MGGIAEGFVTIGALILIGVFVGHIGLFDMTAQRVLTRLSFSVAAPALLIVVLYDTDISLIFSTTLVSAAISTTVVVALYVGLSRLFFRQRLAETTIGALCASYPNAGNLGLPVAAYVLGDAALATPMMLFQLLVVHPIVLTLLDTTVAKRKLRWWQIALRPVQNPLIIATIIGVTLSVTGVRIPALVFGPLSQVAAVAIPAILIAFGIALRLGPKPGSEVSPGVLGLTSALKLVVHPAIAFAVAFALGAPSHILLTVTVMAALPTGQNVFIFASRYGRGIGMARDVTFVTTILSVGVVAAIALVLG